MNHLHRIFLAVSLPEKTKQDLLAYQEQWLDLPANWTRRDNLHITLVFFGNATDQETADICQTAELVAKRHEPLTVTFNRIAYGPPQKIPPRMIWAQGDNSPALAELRQDLENSLYDLGSGRLEKTALSAFCPHVTLAKIKQFEIRKMDPEEVCRVNEDVSLSFTVESIEVMESESKKGGAVYTILESAKLGYE